MSDYQAKWQEFNKLRRQYLLAMLAGAVALALGAARDFSDNAMNTLPLNFTILIFVVFYFYAAFRISRWPCPRCEKPFSPVLRNVGVISTSCDSCGLPKNSSGAPAPDLR